MLTVYKGDYTVFGDTSPPKDNTNLNFTNRINKKLIKSLKGVPITPRNDRSDRWKGIQHGELVESLWEVMDDLYNYKPVNPVFAVAPNGAALIGGFELSKLEKGKLKPLLVKGIPQKTTYAFGMLHSNDSRKAAKFCIGGRVALCMNGLVSASEIWKRKHTKGLFLKDWLREKFSLFMDKRELAGAQTAALVEQSVTRKSWDNLVLRLCRESVLPWRLAGQLDKSWSLARDNEIVSWVPGDQGAEKWDFNANLWDAYNAITHTSKDVPPAKQLDTLEKSFRICLDLVPSRKLSFSVN